jgi:hypothetical protein
MDGLSGAASVVAVVSLAIQLAEGIQKLSEFWKAVQDAPTNVGMLFDELETLSTVLNQPHSISLGTEQDDITEKVLRNCQAHISRLQLKLLKANVGFGSNHFAIRKWSALGITIKKSEIESLRAAIDKAKSTLMISKLSSIQYFFYFLLQSRILTLKTLGRYQLPSTATDSRLITSHRPQ